MDIIEERDKLIDLILFKPIPYAKRVRLKLGLSKQGFSNYTGVSQKTIKKWDSGCILTFAEKKYLEIIEGFGHPPKIKRIYQINDSTIPGFEHLLEITKDFQAHTTLYPDRVHVPLLYWLTIEDMNHMDGVRHIRNSMDIYNTGLLATFFGASIYWHLANDIRMFAETPPHFASRKDFSI